MISYSNTWLYASVLYPETTIDKSFVAHQADALLLMLYPHLTEAGKKVIQDGLTTALA